MGSREPNERLAALLTEARLSRKAFARAVQAEADRRGDLISVDHTAVSRWLGGGGARPATARHIAVVLSTRLGRRVTEAEVGLAAPPTFAPSLGLGYGDDVGSALDVAEQLLDGDLAEAATLHSAPTNSAAWAEASLGWLVRPDADQLPALAAGRRVGLADVAVLRQTTSLFSQMDDRFGGDHGRRAVAQFLRSDVAPLLRGSYTEATGQELFAAAAGAVHLLAWMSYDAGVHGMAQRYFIQALRLAHAGQDTLWAASTLDAMSHQATFLGRFKEAANLARAARSGTRSLATPTLTAHFFAMEARALAGAGDVAGTEAALGQATSLFERRNPDDDPDFIQYFDAGELAAEVGHCYRDLGRGAQAVEAAGVAMTGSPRSDFFVTMVQAESLLLANDLEQACSVARTALDVGTQMKSARCTEYVRTFRQRLSTTATGSAAAVDLADYAAENALWLAAGEVA